MKRVGAAKIAKVLFRHKLLAVLAIALIAATAVGLTFLGTKSPQQNAEPVATATPKAHQKSDSSDMTKLGVTQAAIDNSKPTSTTAGTCEKQISSGGSDFYVTTQLADGSYKCLTYNLKDLQDYTPGSGTTTSDGKTPVKQGTFHDTDTGTTTTITQYSDGSSMSSTDGSYWKMYFDKANSFYIMTNGTDMTTRFAYCMTTGYTDATGQTDIRLLTPAEQQQRAAQPYPYAGPDCNAGNMPVVHYQ